MVSERTKHTNTSPASCSANKDEKKECQVCSKPATDDILECIWCEKHQHTSCSKLSNEQCKGISNLNTPNIAYLLFVYSSVPYCIAKLQLPLSY